MKNLIAFLLFVAVSYTAGASPDWKLKKENDHIKIYTADVAGSSFKTVKVECTVTGSFSQVIATLFDIDKQKEWVYNDKYSRLLKKVSDNEMLYYSEVSVPWPCSNRDFVAHLKVTQTSADMVTIVSHAEPAFMPEKNGLVRIKSSNAKWTMTALGNNQIRIDYVVQFDPSGAVPAWLINMFVTKGPYETFDQLQARMNLPTYQNAHFSFIKD